MRLKRFVLLGSGAVLVGVVACGVESVQAKNYDQSCTKDDDCILVEELAASGTTCTVHCSRGAINKKAKEKYEAELSEERADCTTLAQPDCLANEIAACVQGKCSASSPPLGDAGTD
jgi:hypothetical protein